MGRIKGVISFAEKQRIRQIIKQRKTKDKTKDKALQKEIKNGEYLNMRQVIDPWLLPRESVMDIRQK
ncbi:MAG: hypothetical protein KAI62_01220 [Actinomycetia bacterium]|nr:hypothetical protein [Actinomycetes bacterium]